MKLEKKKYGYFQVEPIPSIEELQKHYENKYFQNNQGGYSSSYTDDEVQWKLFQEWLIVKGLIKLEVHGRVLDIGCGEGYLLKVLSEHGFNCYGVDYSAYGIKKENPEMVTQFLQADINDFVQKLGILDEYDAISLLHVIEHVRDPESLLKAIKSKMKKSAIVVIRFPNDHSKLHRYIQEKTDTPSQWWFAPPEHISYFNHESMTRLLENLGFEIVGKVADHPIDFNLLNDNSNYIINKEKGKATHKYRVLLDNFLSGLDKDKYFSILEQYAEMGVGRSLTFFAKLSGD